MAFNSKPKTQNSKLLLFIFLLLFLSPLQLWAGEANVFIYHRFGDERYPSTNIAVETFAAQLQLLKDENYTVLTLGEIVRRLGAGEALPQRCAALTVDDGYETFLTGAMPLLRRFAYPVTLFVSTDAVGRPGYLSWEQLRALAREGVEIGNHSATHDYLLDRRRGEDEAGWRKRVREDIARAQQLLRKEVGEVSAVFAYPYGEYSPELAAIVRELGFAGATAQQSGVIRRGGDLYSLPRFPMGGDYATLREFRDKLRMRGLPVRVVQPAGPVLEGENPPLLVVDIEGEGIDLGRLRCFVQGQGEAVVQPDAEVAGRFHLQAARPLSGRRGKYTLTAPGKKSGEWYWFSQLWIKTVSGER